MLSCPYKSTFGIECPGCGMQRSLLMLLRGNFYESFKLYPATIPLLFMLFFLFLHVKYKFVYGADILKNIFIFNAVIIALNYIIKLML
jgi:hypothetical protein